RSARRGGGGHAADRGRRELGRVGRPGEAIVMRRFELLVSIVCVVAIAASCKSRRRGEGQAQKGLSLDLAEREQHLARVAEDPKKEEPVDESGVAMKMDSDVDRGRLRAKSIEQARTGGVLGSVRMDETIAADALADGNAPAAGPARLRRVADREQPTRAWFPETFLFEPLVVTDDAGAAT